MLIKHCICEVTRERVTSMSLVGRRHLDDLIAYLLMLNISVIVVETSEHLNLDLHPT